ncbi:GntR family transcriptional regulator [Schlesneria paludicola]|uniref:GntR family transcriptional regulator n=1 Tax=Schlesneria paludicola TaxID=360056 RepID=UPI00029A1CA3|nr:GntR family transcriptional regulator [Schlesneria paludicola]
MVSEPKYRQISRELLEEIAAGRYGPAGKLPSEGQLVKRFRVSRPTAARALRELQEQGLLERRVGSGTFLSAPHVASKSERPQLGLLIPGLGKTEIFEVICGELASLTRGDEIGLVWCGTPSPQQTDEERIHDAESLCEQFIQKRVGGVFFAPFEHTSGMEEVNRRLAERLQQAGIAVLLLDRDITAFPHRSDFDLVSVDNFAASYQLTEHLLKLGCKELVFVAPPFSAPTVNSRIAGSREALLDYGLPIPKKFVRLGDPDDPQLVKSLMAGHKLDAVLCSSDRVAAVLIQSFERANLRVPKELRVVGFDDIKYATLLSPPLTTMHQPCREIAMTAFRALLDRMQNPSLPPRGFVLPARLVVRESCGAYLMHGR